MDLGNYKMFVYFRLSVYCWLVARAGWLLVVGGSLLVRKVGWLVGCAGSLLMVVGFVVGIAATNASCCTLFTCAQLQHVDGVETSFPRT